MFVLDQRYINWMPAYVFVHMLYKLYAMVVVRIGTYIYLWLCNSDCWNRLLQIYDIIYAKMNRQTNKRTDGYDQYMAQIKY